MKENLFELTKLSLIQRIVSLFQRNCFLSVKLENSKISLKHFSFIFYINFKFHYKLTNGPHSERRFD